MPTSAKFDTATYEEQLVDAGVAPAAAKAHRLALVSALEGVTTVQQLEAVGLRLEKAISDQTAKIEVRITFLLTASLGFVSILIGAAVTFLKLT